MTEAQEREFIENAFQKLIERGLIQSDEICPSTLTDEDILTYETKFNIKLPSFFKTFLKCYSYDFKEIAAPLPEDIDPETIRELEEGEEDECYYDTLWLQILSIPKEEPLTYLIDKMQEFREFIESTYDILKVTLEDMKNFVLIGDWGDGWGPLLIDLSKPDEKVNINDMDTWNIVWFDHEDFPWKEPHDDNVAWSDALRNRPAAPDFKTLLEWYFCGKFDKSYETQLQEDGEEMPDYSTFIERYE